MNRSCPDFSPLTLDIDDRAWSPEYGLRSRTDLAVHGVQRLVPGEIERPDGIQASH
jgi:hypothetical protein